MKDRMEAISKQSFSGIQAFLKGRLPLLLCLFSLLSFFISVSLSTVEAAAGNKTVRVGWFESRLCSTDRFGRRSGYAYEYQQKLAAYTGWKYEYVNGSWTQLLQMLRRGEIDLLSDVSYTEDRARDMLFSSLPMGEEIYYVFIKGNNSGISPNNYTTFNGKRVGVNKNTLQEKLFAAWAEKHGITPEIVGLTGSSAKSRDMLSRGEIDAYVTYDASGEKEEYIPVCKLGSSSIYFAVSKTRPDLQAELDMGMDRIQEENRFYNMQLYEKYIRATGSNVILSAGEQSWLARNRIIRVGYRDDYMPYCDRDEKNNLTGALKDYLAMAANCHRDKSLYFQPIAYPSTEAALKALQDGEVDCMFPVNMSSYDGEQMNIMMTNPPVRVEMYAIVRAENQHSFRFGQKQVAAINKGNNNRKTFIENHFPNWETKFFASYDSGLQAVAEHSADCFLFSTYRLSRFADRIENLGLVPINTGTPMELSFAVRRDNPYLYSVLNKTINLVPQSSVNSALAAHTYENRNYGLAEFIRYNLVELIAIIAIAMVLFFLLVLRNMKAEKKALERKQLISVTESDPLTGLYSNNYFFEYVNRIRQKHPETSMDAVAMDIEQFLVVSDLNGREFCDSVLRILAGEIRTFLKVKETDGIASHIEGDRFNIYCRHQEDYQSMLEWFQARLDEKVRNVNIRLRMGVMPGQKDMDTAELFTHAWTACNSVRGAIQTHLMIYNDQMRQQEHFNQRLLNDMRRGVEEHEFKVYYQPKYDIQSEPPRLSSAEALVRWQHHELGMIPPDSFIPLFEQNGLISALDKYVWSETARQIAAWQKKFGIALPVSVNLSRVDIFNPKLEEILDAIVQRNGLECSLLKLEVTESAYTENAEQMIAVISRLRNKGYRIEMDDFGSGYSSLNLLSSLPVDVLKMDRAFVLNIEHSEKAMRLVELILDIAKNLKLRVVAEGVETKGQITLLKNAGCPLVQGYYFSSPLIPEEFETLIVKEIRIAGEINEKAENEVQTS